MARGSGEFTAGTLDGVGIAVALGAGHGEIIGGDEFVKRSAMAVRGYVAAFRLSDLQEVASNAREADGLRWSGAAIRGRHLLQIEKVHCKEKRGTNQKAFEKAHAGIVTRPPARFKRNARRVALGNNGLHFRPESQPLC